MPVSQPRTCPPRRMAMQLATGQIAMLDLRARTSVVAVEGDLHLRFRDSSLAWLDGDAPDISIRLPEGERYVMPQRAVVWMSNAHANAAIFIEQPERRAKWLRSVIHQLLRPVSHLKMQLRRLT